VSRLNKIDKLLRLYENNPEDAEAASALKKAADLMREHIDDPGAGILVDKKRIKDLEQRERDVDKICRGCGKEKPLHHDDCLSHQLERRVGRASQIGCFSCAGIILLWFVTSLVELLIRVFG